MRLTPVAVSGLGSGVMRVVTGLFHTCALTGVGTPYCWGANAWGQVGDGTTTDRWTPVPVALLPSGVTAVAPGGYHTCALTVAGAVVCWGRNYTGQLGDGTTTDRETPVLVSGLDTGGVALASTGSYHGCALTSDGAVQCWGYNGYGQLGDGTTTTRLAPVWVGVHRPPQDGDGNGTSDVIWKHVTGGEVWFWPMQGTTVGTPHLLGTVADSGWGIVGRGDQTGDGKADLLWRHATTGAVYLWTMDGNAIVDVSCGRGGSAGV